VQPSNSNGGSSEELIQLEMFVAIVEQRSVRRAATRVSAPLDGQASNWPAEFFKLCRK